MFDTSILPLPYYFFHFILEKVNFFSYLEALSNTVFNGHLTMNLFLV